MTVIKCKMCGGDIELSADRTYGTCDSCGSMVTLPLTDDEQRVALFNRGNYFRQNGDFDKALAIYEGLIREDDTDAEAHWCCALCRFGIDYVKDPQTHAWIPTCHRASFDSFLEDIDYQSTLQYSEGTAREQYRKDAESIARVQKDILAVSQHEQPFDIFICYKETDENGERTKDSTLAQEMYYELNELGFRVFFSRITLEDKPGIQYEPYIFAALNSAKIMIVVGTEPKYMNAVWVRNEWSRFLALMRKDRSKLLIPCYRDMEAYDLPEQLSVLQAYNMEKIGFLQDLVRGVTKILGKQPADEHASVPMAAPALTVQPNVAVLLERGQTALEAGNWQDADALFEQALDHNPMCAEAYMGEFLALQKTASFDQFLQQFLQETQEAEAEHLEAVEEDDERLHNAISKYTAKKLIKADEIKATYRFDRTYPSVAAKRAALRNKVRTILDTNRLFKRARQFARGSYLESIEKARATFLQQMDQLVDTAYDEETKVISSVREAYARHLEEADAAIQRAYLKRKRKRHIKIVVFSISVILFLVVLYQIDPTLMVFGIFVLTVFRKQIFRKLGL